MPVLSSREKEILTLISEGYTNPQIAEKYFLVSLPLTATEKFIGQTECKNTATLIKFAVEHKLI